MASVRVICVVCGKRLTQKKDETPYLHKDSKGKGDCPGSDQFGLLETESTWRLYGGQVTTTDDEGNEHTGFSYAVVGPLVGEAPDTIEATQDQTLVLKATYEDSPTIAEINENLPAENQVVDPNS